MQFICLMKRKNLKVNSNDLTGKEKMVRMRIKIDTLAFKGKKKDAGLIK